MAHADPDPERSTESAADPDAEPPTPSDPAGDPEADTEADNEPDAEAEPQPDPEKAQRTEARFLWMCGWLTLLVGVFLLSDNLRDNGKYGAGAWLGVVVVVLCLLALIAAYVLCALDRSSLRTRLVGPVDLFQLTTVLMLVTIIVGVLVPPQNRTALALILPWGLSYWLYNLPRTTSDES
ncbi:hypothetical protein AB0E69_32035 [Kribbella sp. NPDC026611]|uniref:hypothetical protein n=1 Tax=Kribbella sp. NPDC026611 TaxID=3154911 RepID=UPI0033ECDF39